MTSAVSGKGNHSVKIIPSYIFAGIGVALIALGIAGMAYSSENGVIGFSAVVAVLGLIQVIYGGLLRRGEDVTSSPAPPADAG